MKKSTGLVLVAVVALALWHQARSKQAPEPLRSAREYIDDPEVPRALLREALEAFGHGLGAHASESRSARPPNRWSVSSKPPGW